MRRPPSRIALAALALVASAGCATVENARRAQDPASEIPGERTPTAAELGIPATGPLKLKDAVHAALQVHPSVIRARRTEEAAGARVGEAESSFLPQVGVNASTQYQNRRNTPGVREQHRFETLGFSVSWLLFDFGRTPALARQSALQWYAAQADAKTAEVDAAFAVRSAYYTLVSQIQLRDVASDAVRQFQTHLDQVKEFVKVGTRIPYDQTKAEVDVGNAQLDLVRAENAVLVAQANLANAMGLAEITSWTPAAEAEPLSPPATFEDAWRMAQQSRPSLAAAEAREEAASALVDAQIADLYPRLSLGLGASESGGRTPLSWSWNAGPSVSWTPFDGFRNLYTIDEAVADLRSARASRTQEEQSAWLETRSAWLAIEDARRRVDLTALIVRNAQENVNLAQGRYDAGVGTAVELSDAQHDVTQARAEEVQARADRDLAASRLWKSLGASDRAPPRPEPPAPPAPAPAPAPAAPGRQP